MEVLWIHNYKTYTYLPVEGRESASGSLSQHNYIRTLHTHFLTEGEILQPHPKKHATKLFSFLIEVCSQESWDVKRKSFHFQVNKTKKKLVENSLTSSNNLEKSTN